MTHTPRKLRRLLANIVLTVTVIGLSGCHTDMWHQPKAKAQSESQFFVDGQSDRPLPANTVPVGYLRADNAFYTGKEGNKPISQIPMPITREFLRRGQERYEVFCSPCHGRTGDGKGMIALRGLAIQRPPATFHTDRLRQLPVGHFYDVVTNGYGVMYSYASRIPPEDRWAIAAYVRVLQLSQYAKIRDLTPEDIQRLNEESLPQKNGSSQTQSGAQP